MNNNQNKNQFYKKISLAVIFSLLLSLIPIGVIEAHPGRTDSNGGHYCRTNCAKWGLQTGEYHYHNGGGNSKKKTTKPKVQEPKKQVVKKTEPKKQQTKKQEPKKQEPKKQEVKKTEVKKKESILPNQSQETPKQTASELILPQLQPAGTLQLYFLDVGQGDSTLIRTPNGRYGLIDTGNILEVKNMNQYLDKLGVNELDVVIATSSSDNQTGGLINVLKNYDVQQIYVLKPSNATGTYRQALTQATLNGLSIQSAEAGVSLELDGVNLEFLSPVSGNSGQSKDESAVVKITYQDTSFLFSNSTSLQSVVNLGANSDLLKASLLKIGESESNQSISKAVINAIHPQYAIVPSQQNKQAQASTEIAKIMTDINAASYTASKHGTITAISDGNKITFVTTKTSSK